MQGLVRTVQKKFPLGVRTTTARTSRCRAARPSVVRCPRCGDIERALNAQARRVGSVNNRVPLSVVHVHRTYRFVSASSGPREAAQSNGVQGHRDCSPGNECANKHYSARRRLLSKMLRGAATPGCLLKLALAVQNTLWSIAAGNAILSTYIPDCAWLRTMACGCSHDPAGRSCSASDVPPRGTTALPSADRAGCGCPAGTTLPTNAQSAVRDTRNEDGAGRTHGCALLSAPGIGTHLTNARVAILSSRGCM